MINFWYLVFSFSEMLNEASCANTVGQKAFFTFNISARFSEENRPHDMPWAGILLGA